MEGRYSDEMFVEPTSGELKNPLIDWYQYVSPQPGLGGRQPLHTQGKTSGGGIARNFLNYQRRSVGSLQKWADEVGDQSYTWQNMLPYFKKSVTFHAPEPVELGNVSFELASEQFNQNHGGPVQVAFPGYINPISTWLGAAFTASVFGRLPAFSNGKLFGWSYFTYTVDFMSQTRSSSETAFLRETLWRSTNVNFYKTTLAKKIEFDGLKAVSVTSWG